MRRGESKADGASRPGRRSTRSRTGTSRLGGHGEALAAALLEQKGYRIVARNFRCLRGEVDLIATQGEILAFVEVKTRQGQRVIDPVLAVTARKMERLRMAATIFLASHPEIELQPRFDVISVILVGSQPELRHIENAFQ